MEFFTKRLKGKCAIRWNLFTNILEFLLYFMLGTLSSYSKICNEKLIRIILIDDWKKGEHQVEVVQIIRNLQWKVFSKIIWICSIKEVTDFDFRMSAPSRSCLLELIHKMRPWLWTIPNLPYGCLENIDKYHLIMMYPPTRYKLTIWM